MTQDCLQASLPTSAGVSQFILGATSTYDMRTTPVWTVAYYYEGMLDDIRLWKIALTQNEITALVMGAQFNVNGYISKMCYWTCQDCNSAVFDDCTLCNDVWYLDTGQCVEDCFTAAVSKSASPQACASCGSGCLTCTDFLPNQCQSCGDPYYLDDQTCSETCITTNTTRSATV